MPDFGDFVVLTTGPSGASSGGATAVSVPGSSSVVLARAAGAAFDVSYVDADTVTLLLPSTASREEIQEIANQLLYVFGVVDASTLGWLTVTASGILGMADSSDLGGEPDYVPVAGTVTFTPSLARPIRILSQGKFFAVAGFTATFDSDGEMSYDGIKGVRIVAPLWSDLTNTAWRWNAEVRPGPGQSWSPFSVSFTGAPGAVINLASLIS